MSKKVGLLTLPLSDNFGGMLQIIALYKVLEQEGFDVTLIDKQNLRSPLKGLLASLFEVLPMQNYRGHRGRHLARNRHAAVLRDLMPKRTRKVKSGREIEVELSRLGVDTVVVGSDQVWRFEYQGDGEELNYFLDFGGPNLRRIAYAASFGHGRWTYPGLTVAVTSCLKRFDRISVRENTGLEILKGNFGISDAVLTSDPTVLLPRSFYEELSRNEKPQPGIMCYAIDRSDTVNRLIDDIERHLGQQGQTIRISPYDNNTSIGAWLRRFRDADYVVTDSFHGVVFSILFEREFLVVPNRSRGLDRFLTVLKQVDLEDRMVHEIKPTEVAQKLAVPIDYSRVRQRLELIRRDSLKFLRESLA